MTRSRTYDIEHNLRQKGNYLYAGPEWQKCIPGGYSSIENAKAAATAPHSWNGKPYRIVCVSIQEDVVFESQN